MMLILLATRKSVLETIKSYEADILEQEQDITEIGKAYEELMTWSGTFGPQFRGAVSPGFKSMFPYLRSDPPPDEEDPDSAEQELKPATEVRGILKDALESIKQEDEEKGGKTSYTQTILIALDHIVATQERQRITLAGMSDPLHRYALRILEKQLNEPDAPSPSTTPRTPPVRRAVRFPDEAPGSYGGPNDC